MKARLFLRNRFFYRCQLAVIRKAQELRRRLMERVRPQPALASFDASSSNQFVGVELLEARIAPALTTNFAAGVLTFTGDGAADHLVLKATGVASTVEYDDGNSAGGFVTQAGVTKIVIDSGGGDDSIIFLNGNGNVLAPASGIDLTAGTGTADQLTLGGGGANFTVNYTATGSGTGSIQVSNGSLTQSISILGGLETINDLTSGSSVSVSSTNANDNISVVNGPILAPQFISATGPIFIDGGDRDDHGFANAGVNQDGWKFIQQALNFLNTNQFNSGATKQILALGVTGPGTQAYSAIQSAATALGLSVDFASGASISTANFNDYRVIYVPSDSGQVTGGLSQTDANLLAARVGDVKTFIKSGGGVFAMTEDDLTNPYAWLQIPNAFTIGHSNNDTMIQTPALAAAGFNITNTELTNGTPVHNYFTGPAGFNGLDVFVNNANGQVITLGHGAVSESIPGGQTTKVTFGDGSATLNFANKSTLGLATQDGIDTVTVNLTTPALGLSAVNIKTGKLVAPNGAPSSIFIKATPAAVTTTATASVGADAFFVGDDTNSIDQIKGALLLNGGSGLDYLGVRDQGDTDANNYTITSGTVSRAGAALITYNNGGSSFENLEVSAGSASNLFTVTPATAAENTTITVNGATPTTPLGDQLAYQGSGFLTLGAAVGSGTISQAGFRDVIYTGIETVDSTGTLHSITIDASYGGFGTLNDGVADGFEIRGVGDRFEIYTNGNFIFGGKNAAFQRITFAGSGDNDTLTVNSANGLVNVADRIQFDGGAGSDLLVLTGGTALTDIYAPGPILGTGTSTMTSAAGTQRVAFTGLEPVIDTVAGTLTVLGTDADNAISYTAGVLNPTFGRVAVDAQESIEFSNKTTLTINAGAGKDTISLHSSLTPATLANIVINGGDSTVDDVLIVNGITGALDNIRYVPTAARAGQVLNDSQPQPNVTFAAIEHLEVVVDSSDGDGLRVDGTAGNDQWEFSSGATSDSGILRGTMDANNATGNGPFEFAPIVFHGVTSGFNDLDLNFFVPGGTDTLVFNGTSDNDAIVLSSGQAAGADVTNTVAGQLVAHIEGFNLSKIILRGNNGDDSFNVSFPFGGVSTLAIEGGDPSSNDTVTLTGNGASALILNTGATSQTVSGAGLGTTTLTGVEVVNLSNGAGAITINGGASNDSFSVSPTGANTTKVTLAGVNQVITTNNTGTLTLDGNGGSDSVTYVGLAGVDTITATLGVASSIANAGLRTVTLQTATFASIRIESGASNDSVTLTGTANLSLFTVDGGDGGDTIDASAVTTGGVTLIGGADNDVLVGGAGSDNIYGGAGHDRLTGNAGNDQLFGGDDSDVIYSTLGTDFADGGDGEDLLNFSNTTAGDYIVESFNGPHVVLTGPAGAFVVSESLEEISIGYDNPAVSPTYRIRDLTGTEVKQINVRVQRDFNFVLGQVMNGTLLVEGSVGNDTISLTNAPIYSGFGGTGVPAVQTGWGRVHFNTGAAGSAVRVDGLQGDDTLRVDPSFNPTHFGASPTQVRFNGNDGNDTLIGGTGDDVFDGGAGDDTFIGGGGTDAVGGGVGSSVGDKIQISGTTGADNISMSLNASGHLVVTVNGATTTYTNFLAGPIATSGLELISIDGGEGADSVTIDSTNGAIAVPISFAGGAGNDTLTLTGGTATSDIYSPGPAIGQGTSTLVIGGVTQLVTFTGLEPVIDLVAGPLTVLGSQANNAISYTQGSVAARGLVAVDAQESIEFSNKTTLTINALGGTDTISLVNASTPTGLTSITVAGGDTTGIDSVVLGGTSGADNIGVTLTGADSATVTGIAGVPITLQTTGHLAIDGNGGADALTVTTPAGGDVVAITPGTILGTGTIDARRFVALGGDSLVPISFTGITGTGTLTVADAAAVRSDEVVINGTSFSDVFAINSAGLITVDAMSAGGTATRVLNSISTPGAAFLKLIGGDGDDTFNIAGNHPITSGILIEGGNPDGGDTLNFTATAATAVSVTAKSITQTGSGPVSFLEVGSVNLALGGQTLTVDGTTGDDYFTVTPSAADAGSFTHSIGGVPTATTFSYSGLGAAALTFNGGASGFDQVELVGTDGADTFTATATSVTRTGTVTFGTGLDRLVVRALGGDDTITLTSFNAAGATIYAGDGNDTVFGTALADIIYGGAGNDALMGGAGNDTVYGEEGNDRLGDPFTADATSNDAGNDSFYGGAGSDTFVWDPGDGSDLIEGGEGNDALVFNGAAAAENFTLNAIGTRLQVLRNLGAISMDIAGIEQLDVNANGGADSLSVNDLSTTELVALNLNLGPADAANDSVSIQGRSLADNITISQVGAGIRVDGLNQTITITAPETTDSLSVSGNAGDDRIAVLGSADTFIRVSLNGNEGDDLLIGGTGNDTFDGGTGDDTFVTGGGSDNVGGGAGASIGDTLLISGTAGDDVISLALNATGQLLATINGATSTVANFLGGAFATSGIERIKVDGGNGVDALTVDSTNGAIPAPTIFDGGSGIDTLTLTGGTATSDTYTPGPIPGDGTSTIVIGGVTQTVNFKNLEPVIDLVAGPLTVLGTNANNAISYQQGSVNTRGLVAVDEQEFIEFSNKTTLTINALGGADTISLNNPSTPTGLTSIVVSGGDPTSGDTLILSGNAAANDQFRLAPTGAGAGTITNGANTPISFTGIEGLNVTLQYGSDFFTVDGTTGNDDYRLFSGSNPGQYRIEGTMNQTVAAFALPTINVTGNSNSLIGTLNFNGAGGTDRLTVTGTTSNDDFSVLRAGANSGSVNHSINGLLTNFIGFANLSALTLEGLDGDDTFSVPGNLATTISVTGGDNGADVLTFTGSGAGAVTVNIGTSTVQETGFGAVTFSGVQSVNANATNANATFIGTAADDLIDATPTAADNVRFQVIGNNPVVNLINVGATLSLDGGTGTNRLIFNGTDSSDIVDLSRLSGALSLSVSGRQAVTTTNTFFAWTINSGAGADTINVNDNGAINLIEIAVNAGAEPNDTLTNSTAFNTTYQPGTDNDAGSLTSVAAISFSGIDAVTVTSASGTSTTGTITAGAGSNQITLVGTGATTVTAKVDNHATVTFTGATLSTINVSAGAGDDVISVAPGTFTGAGGINVDGGDPTASDTLIVVGTSGNDTIGYNPSNTIGSGSVTRTGSATVNFTTTEFVKIDGAGGTDALTLTTPAGVHQLTFRPGVAPDAGTVDIRGTGGGTTLTPLSFSKIGAGGTVNFASAGGREDILELYGTNDSDVFTVNAVANVVQITNPTGGFVTTTLNTSGINGLQLRALEGDDTFNVAGSLPYTAGVLVDGGDPSSNDTLNFNGTGANAVSVDFGASTVQQATFSIVSYFGIEVVNANATNANATFTATAGDDVVNVTPTGTDSVRFQVNGANPVVNLINVGATMTLAGGGGTDGIVFNGTANNDIINLARTPGALTLEVAGRQIVTTTNSFFSWTVNGLEGSDTFNLTDANPVQVIDLTINGGAGGGDVLNNFSAANTAYRPGTDSDAGFLTRGGLQTAFTGIDAVNITLSGVGTTGTIDAGSGSNQINLVGTGATTVVATVDGHSPVTFTGATLTTLSVLAGAGDDVISVTPGTFTGAGGINVDGGDPTASDTLIVVGTSGNDTIGYNPSNTIGSGSVTRTGVATVNFTTTELVKIDGSGGTDALTLTTPASTHFVTFHPGAAPDSGTIDIRGAVGGTTLTPLSFSKIGATGTVNFASAGGREDVLELYGTNDSDTFNVTGTIDTVQIVNSASLFVTTPLNTAGINFLQLRSLEGDDTFNIAGTLPYASLIVDAGDPSTNDTVNLSGASGAVTVSLSNLTVTGFGGTVSLLGVETLNANTNTQALTVNGTGGADAITYTPTGAAAGTVKLAGLNTVVNFSNATSTFTLDAGAGADVVTVVGTSGADTISVARAATTTVQVGALKTVSLPSAATESLVVQAGLGSDTINVSGTGGPAVLEVQGESAINGGDRLNITNSTAGTTTFSPGVTSDSGLVNTPDGVVSYGGIEFVGLTGSAATDDLVVQGTNASDTIAIQFLGGANRAWVNNSAPLNFLNFDDVTLQGRFGDDQFSVTPAGLVGVVNINIDGGDPTASDALTVTGTAGSDTFGYNPSNQLGAGSVTLTGAPTVNFTNTEGVKLDGVGGNDALTLTTPASVHQVTFLPGSAPDSGTINVRGAGGGTALVPLSFSHLGASGTVTFASAGGREDVLELYGTNDSDVISVTGATDTVQIINPTGGFVTTTLKTGGINALQLRGLEGDDTFNLSGGLPYAGGVLVDAGGPTASDVVNLSGATAAVNVALSNLTVTGYGSTVTLLGTEVLNTSVNGQALTVSGTVGGDNFTYIPTAAAAGTVKLAGVNTVVNFSTATSTFTLDASGGADSLTVVGTQGIDSIVADATTVTVNALKTVNYLNTENIVINAAAGDDNIDVTPATNTTIFVDGGDPIGNTAGDRIVLHPPAAFMVQTGPEIDEGGLLAATAQRVSWDHIEAITIIGGGPALILGTNGDDDITILARDASTHLGADGVQDFTATVNNNLEILFINQPQLFIDALAGDDDVVVREPAPNSAVWNVSVTATGGPASSITGDQGDVFHLETPGTQSITYTPTGVDTGLVADATNNSSFSLVSSFTIPALSYVSSPGGFEQFNYDGKGGNDAFTLVAPAGVNTITHQPGKAFDEGSLRVNALLGVNYQNLGAIAAITVNGAAGTDTLVVNGTDADDTFSVAAATGSVTLNNRLPLNQTGVEALVLNGFDGDETFNIAGAHPFGSGITLRGGNPSIGSDVLNFTAGGATSVQLAAGTITGGGGPVSLVSIELANIIGAGNTVAVTGTADDDTFAVTPSAAGAGSFRHTTASGTPKSPLFTYSTVGSITFDGGASGFDVLQVIGTEGADSFTSTATTVTTTGTVTAGASLERLDVLALGGDDDVAITNFTATPLIVVEGGAGNDTVTLAGSSAGIIRGGEGDDTLTGSSNADRIEGGDGNDTITGAVGGDSLFGGTGSDSFVWNNGDGSDLIEGGDGDDAVIVNGSTAAGDAFIVTANGARVNFSRTNLGLFTLSIGGVEQLDVNGGAGADSLEVTNLATTDLRVVRADLGAADGAADSVIVDGTIGNDQISASTTGGLSVFGLKTEVQITSSEVANDTLTINGLDGDDTIKANVGVETAIKIVLSGGAGNDRLTGDGTLLGGADDDTLEGGLGDNILDGGTGTDRVVATGDVNFTLTNTTLTGLGTDTLLGIEQVALTGGPSANTFNVGAYTGRVILDGEDGSDTLDLSAALTGVIVNLDQLDITQTINASGLKVVFKDIIENFAGTNFKDVIAAGALSVPRFIDGNLTDNQGDDTLLVDAHGTFTTVIKSDYNTGTVRVPFYPLISFDQVENIVVANTTANNGFGGNGNGTGNDSGIGGGTAYQTPTSYYVGQFPTSVATGDLNGDGFPDIVATTSYGKTNIAVLMSDGFGSFSAATKYNSGGLNARNITLADVDGDGDLDLLTLNSSTTYFISLMKNDGAGNFAAPTLITTARGSMSMAIGDLTGDGKPEIVTANPRSSTMHVLINNGTGSFGAFSTVKTGGSGTIDVGIADFNNDGINDIVALNPRNATVALFRGDNTGVFSAATLKLFKVGASPTKLAIADFNADGRMDIAVNHTSSRMISVLLGTGTPATPPAGQFRPFINIVQSRGAAPGAFVAGDFNSDGTPDLGLAGAQGSLFRVLLGTQNGVFGTPGVFVTGVTPTRLVNAIAVADFNNDGGNDVVLSTPNSQDIIVILRNKQA